ncbi:serine threonine kinase 33 [Apiospora arundinis]|uniref:Serine threonine kinase 33 n=1 Tax=Apiospora arundinis TaxID=335852 RepID=A0ABR2IAH9_9PEZI
MELREALIGLDQGATRSTLEAVEDLYFASNDPQVRKSLEEVTKQAWAHLLKIETAIEDAAKAAKSTSADKSLRKANEQMKEVESINESLGRQLQLQVARRTLPSKLELQPAQCRIVGEPQRLARSAVFVARADLRTRDVKAIEHCVIEEKCIRGVSSAAAYEMLRDLARLLQYTKTSECLFGFSGFQVLPSTPGADRFQLIFPFPPNVQEPRSLRDILLDPVNSPRPPIPRNFRFILPRMLAKSVYYVHSHNLVHKAIRPESIVMFHPMSSEPNAPRYPEVIGFPYLTDWRYTRKTIDASSLSTESDWTISLYQHPERQAGFGGIAESKYNIGHDIYSLGVCFLEIGLWESFIQYDGETPSLSTTFLDAKGLWESENPQFAASMTEPRKEQQALLLLAGQRLAFEMGEAYSQLVKKCLLCLEHGFGNVTKFVDSTSTDWEQEGVVFIEEIRKELASASTMGPGGPYNLL